MPLPQVVTRDEWLDARRALLDEEKALTRQRDALSTRRRELPMVEVTTDYRFTGPEGEVGLVDLFGGYRQLIVRHFMFDPAWEDGCPSCTAGADELNDGLLEHLHARDTTLVLASRAPLPKLERWKALRGWTIPWYSWGDSGFGADFGTTVDPQDRPPVYNYKPLPAEVVDAADGLMEFPGNSCFLRDGDRVFHTYSNYARGGEWTGGSYAFLDLTVLGRQEDWERPAGRADDARAGVPDFSA